MDWVNFIPKSAVGLTFFEEAVIKVIDSERWHPR
jgi:hypothetical protein